MADGMLDGAFLFLCQRQQKNSGRFHKLGLLIPVEYRGLEIEKPALAAGTADCLGGRVSPCKKRDNVDHGYGAQVDGREAGARSIALGMDAMLDLPCFGFQEHFLWRKHICSASTWARVA